MKRHRAYRLKAPLGRWRVRAVQEAIALNPQNADAWHQQGIVLAELNKYAAAIKSYQKATKLDPDNVSAWQDLGETLYKQKKNERAIAAFNQVARTKDDIELWIYRGDAFYYAKQYERAIELDAESSSI